MIAATPHSGQRTGPPADSRWQQSLADAVTDPAELCRLLGLEPSQLPWAHTATRSFALKVPRGYVARMRRGDPQDPLLLQVLPQAAELIEAPGYVTDPVGDGASRIAPGVLQKYAGRALLIATGACAVHCRYCFRRHFPYGEELASADGWTRALEQLRSDLTINEVILSGGDPLSLSDRRLTVLTEALAGMSHIRRLRIHTRQPVVLPERVDRGLVAWLDGIRLQKVMVLHANHPREIDDAVREACQALRSTGTTLLNQAVLLKGVNDTADVLAALSEALFGCGVLPYYLHALDPVCGASHFAVTDTVARSLIAAVTARLPGYLVPKLVREVAGSPSKTPL